MVHCVGPLCFTKTQQVGSAETQSQHRPHACAGRVPPQESDWSITCRCCGQILSKQSWLWVEDGDQTDASRNLEAPCVLGAGVCKHRSCDQGYITVKECGCDATEQVLDFFREQNRCLNFPRAVFESIAVEILKDQVWCPENLVLRCVNVFSRPECDKQLLILWIQQEVAWLGWLLFVFDRV